MGENSEGGPVNSDIALCVLDLNGDHIVKTGWKGNAEIEVFFF